MTDVRPVDRFNKWKTVFERDGIQDDLVKAIRNVLYHYGWCTISAAPSPDRYRIVLGDPEDTDTVPPILRGEQTGTPIDSSRGVRGTYIEGELDNDGVPISATLRWHYCFIQGETANLTGVPKKKGSDTWSNTSVLTFARLVFCALESGARLRHARLYAGHTQWQVAREVGCSVDAIRCWENGRREPTGKYQQAVEQYIKSHT